MLRIMGVILQGLGFKGAHANIYRIYIYRMPKYIICRIYIHTIISRDITYYRYDIVRIRAWGGLGETFTEYTCTECTNIQYAECKYSTIISHDVTYYGFNIVRVRAWGGLGEHT